MSDPRDLPPAPSPSSSPPCPSPSPVPPSGGAPGPVRGCGCGRFGCLGLVLVCVLGASLVINFMLLSLSVDRVSEHLLGEETGLSRLDEEVVLGGEKDVREKIAVIPVAGVIGGPVGRGAGGGLVQATRLALRKALADPAVKAILLNIDSPGGEVTASDEIYELVRRADQRKPVVAWMGSLAASGGYYIACGARHLIASPTTVTGSIGVVIHTLNYEALLGKIGLEMVVFKSGQFKDLLSGSRKMTPEEREYIQGVVMQIYERFLGIVAGARKLDRTRLRDGVADGRIVTGTDALRERLVDGVGYFEQAVEKARELGGARGARVVRYRVPVDFSRLFGRLLERSASGELTLALPGGLGAPLEAGRIYLLPSTYAR